jgi:hypothetical protein
MYTPIKLEKNRNFRYGMKAISLIEKTLDVKIAKLDLENLSMEDTATIIWAGLVHEDKDLTVDKVMELIDEHASLTEVLETMAKALSEAFGANETEKNLKKVVK